MRRAHESSTRELMPICGSISMAPDRARAEHIPMPTACCGCVQLMPLSIGSTRRPSSHSITRSLLRTPRSSLTAVAVPALGWSGNLWTWNPQLGLTQDVPLSGISAIPISGCSHRCYQSAADLHCGVRLWASRGRIQMRDSRWPGTGRQNRDSNGRRRIRLSDRRRRSFRSSPQHREERDSTPGRARLTTEFRSPVAQNSAAAHIGVRLSADLEEGPTKTTSSPTIRSPATLFRTLDDAGGWAQLKERASNVSSSTPHSARTRFLHRN